nr:repellent protein 1-like [Lolium perenne]
MARPGFLQKASIPGYVFLAQSARTGRANTKQTAPHSYSGRPRSGLAPTPCPTDTKKTPAPCPRAKPESSFAAHPGELAPKTDPAASEKISAHPTPEPNRHPHSLPSRSPEPHALSSASPKKSPSPPPSPPPLPRDAADALKIPLLLSASRETPPLLRRRPRDQINPQLRRSAAPSDNP